MANQKTTKYYVESGPHLQVVVHARNTLQAMLKVLNKIDDDQPLRLADVIIVNRRGFVWDRPDRQLDGDETVMPTRLLLGEPEENVAAGVNCPTQPRSRVPQFERSPSPHC